jgi:hypothetical protein
MSGGLRILSVWNTTKDRQRGYYFQERRGIFMSQTRDRLIEFEEQNFFDLAEKFVHLKSVEDKWFDFVYQEYEESIQDISDAPDFVDDSKQL